MIAAVGHAGKRPTPGHYANAALTATMDAFNRNIRR